MTTMQKPRRKRPGLLAVAAVAALVSPPPAAGQVATADEVTFTKDIAPILQRSCQKCHRPDSLAPMSLIRYEEVRPWARAIKYRTGLRDKPGVMPPWYIEKDIGIQQFKDDFSLSDEEIGTIAKWVDSGAPQGDPADMPPPLEFAAADEWEIGEPDLIVSSPTFEVKALAPDWWGTLGEVPTGLTEDRYVAAVEFKEVSDSRGNAGRDTVGGLFVVHHAAFATIVPDEDGDQRTSMAWPVHEVGRNADIFDAEAGRLLKADSELSFFSVHRHSNGTDTTARLDVGFKFHPRGYEPTMRPRLLFVGNGPDIDIRGMDPDQRLDAYFTLPEHTKISVFEPHMHAPGVRMCLEAIWGVTIQTLNCAGYDHNWVRVYTYEDDVAPLLPKGTILHLIGYFNNSPTNPNVADPRNWSGSGHRSVDNMFINLMQAHYLTEEQFDEELARRREKLRLTEGGTVIGCPLCGSSATRPTAGGSR